ncbi:hypothetical protein ONZ45_g17834 [Pleurotus djamor]|nr:hypothetical protein ONZ45_g17834 [Pleurotus djamor]
MEASRQSNNLQIAVVYHSMTLMMHTLRYLGSLIDQSDELSDDLQQTLQDAIATMEEFGNLVNSYYRYSVKQAIFRVLRSKEYQEQLQEINDTFMRHREEIRNVLEARTMIATYDTRNSLQYVNSNIEKVISMLGAINAKEHKAEEFSRTHGGPEAIIHDDALLSKVAEILGEKLPPQIRSALRKDLQELLENDLTQFKYALQATREQIDESVARSEVAIIRHLDSGPHELIQDPDVKSIWQEMKWRTSVKVRPFVDSLHEYFQRQFALKKLEEGEPPHDSWTLKYLSKVMYHPAIGNAIDEDGSGFVSVHELNHFLENRPIKEWTVPETLVFWSVVWPKSNRIYYEDIMYDLGRIKATIHHMKPIPEAYEEYLKVLDMLDPVVDSLGDGDDGEESEGLQRLLKSYVDVTDAKIQAFLKDTQYRISDTATLDFIIGKSQRIELVVAPLVWLVLNHHVGILEEHGSEIDPEVIGFMCETCISIFFSFLDRYSDLQRGWKQQKVNVALYMDSFASSVFSAMALAEKEGFFEELADNVDEYNDYDGQDDDDEATADSQDKVGLSRPQFVSEYLNQVELDRQTTPTGDGVDEEDINHGNETCEYGETAGRRGNDDDEEEGDDDNGRDEDDDEEDVGRNYDDEDEDDSMTACGHTLGGVHSSNFPDITTNPHAHFDTTHGQFDNRVISEYLDSTTTNPLIVGPSATRSDRKLFIADRNLTVRGMATPAAFTSTCRSILTRMIDTVPRAVTLTAPMTPIPIKPVDIQLTLNADGTLTFSGAIRIYLTGRTDQTPVVRVQYLDRLGNTPSNNVIDTTVPTFQNGIGSGFDGSFKFYQFSGTVSGSTGISSFTVSVSGGDGDELHNNGGAGFPVQDSIIFQKPQSCLVQEPDADGRWNLTIVAAVRMPFALNPSAVTIMERIPRPGILVPTLSPKRIFMRRWATAPGYLLQSATYKIVPEQWVTTFDVETVGANRVADEFKSTMLESNCAPFV